MNQVQGTLESDDRVHATSEVRTMASYASEMQHNLGSLHSCHPAC